MTMFQPGRCWLGLQSGLGGRLCNLYPLSNNRGNGQASGGIAPLWYAKHQAGSPPFRGRDYGTVSSSSGRALLVTCPAKVPSARLDRNLKLIQHNLKILDSCAKKSSKQFHHNSIVLAASRRQKWIDMIILELLMHRWLAQIGLVVPGGPSEDAKAWRA